MDVIICIYSGEDKGLEMLLIYPGHITIQRHSQYLHLGLHASKIHVLNPSARFVYYTAYHKPLCPFSALITLHILGLRFEGYFFHLKWEWVTNIYQILTLCPDLWIFPKDPIEEKAQFLASRKSLFCGVTNNLNKKELLTPLKQRAIQETRQLYNCY